MKKGTPILVLICLIAIGNAAMAQTAQISTKILKSIGFAEVHQIIPEKDGYLIIGSQGTDVMHKKLWMVQLNSKMKISNSLIVHNFDITTPIQYVALSNGSKAILAQEKINDNMQEQSLLFYINANNQIQKTIRFSNAERIHYSSIATSNNKIILGGVAHHNANDVRSADEVAIAALDESGNLIWQKQFNFSTMHFEMQDVLLDNNANVICTGSAMPMYDLETESGKVDKYSKCWMAMQLDENGNFKKQVIIPSYANYNFAKSMIATTDNYIAVLNKANFFGEPLYVKFDKNLNLQKAYSMHGSPALISGVMQTSDKIVLGALFSNDINNYSPGYIYIDNEGDVKAKASATLFDFFFINSVCATNEDGFFVGGTGYNNHSFSDVYLLPFGKDGSAVCDYTEKNISFRKTDVEEYVIGLGKQMPSNITMQTVSAVTQNGDVQISSVCTTPDDLVVPEKENANWNVWQQKNAEVFTFTPPTIWMKLYPNPSTNKVTIEYLAARSDQLAIRVYNQLGGIVLSKVIYNQDKFELDISNLTPGKYFVKVYDGTGEMVETLLKE